MSKKEKSADSPAMVTAKAHAEYAEARWGKDSWRHRDAKKYIDDIKELESK